MRERMNTEEFAARVAAPLKGEVPLSAGFDARVMRAVAEAAQPWWRRRRAFALSPIGGLALAAGLGALMVLGGLGVARVAGPAAPLLASADTVHLVRFVFSAPEAASVTLAGDFNGWSRTATPLEDLNGTGQWSVTVPLTPGVHEYAFVVDGERWMADPSALLRRDEFGQESSLLALGSPARGT